jgi:hypothetical protein
MGVFRWIVPFFFLIGWISQVYSDTLVLKDGEVHEGTLKRVTESEVQFQSSRDLLSFKHDQILSFKFNNSDLLFFKTDSILKCKVFNKVGSMVIVATEAGILEIENNVIRKVENNTGGELKVTGLPPTGPQFVNISHKVVWSGDFKRSFYFQPTIGLQISGLGDWKDQFSPSPSGSGVDLGSAVGFTLNSNVSIGIGYEFFLYQKVEIQGGLNDKLTANFLYAHFQIRSGIKKIPGFFLYAQIDPGFFSGTEKISMSGNELEGSGNVFAFRIRGGCEYFTSGALSIFTEIGGLFANVSNVKVIGQTIPDYTLDFSGVVLLSGFKIYIPFAK